MARPDAIVVGAGFAGLSTATALAERGARVLVLEGRPGLGGRATAYADPLTGEHVDNGQHVLFGCYHETFRFLRRIGTEHLVHLDEALDVEFLDPSGARTRLRAASLPAPWHLLAGLARWPALSWRDRLAALRLGPVLAREARRHARGILPDTPTGATVDSWLVGHRQTRRLIQMLWDPLAVAALNQLPHEAAAEPFVRVLAQMFGRSRRNAAIGLPRVPLDAFYALPAADWLRARGSEVRTRARARIVCEGDRLSHVEVRGERFEAPVVVSTVPWHALAGTLQPVPPSMRRVVADASATGSCPIVTVNVWFDRPVTEVPFLGLPGRTMQWVFDKRQAFGADASHLSLVSSGADAIVARENADLIELALAEVREALPLARDARTTRATVVREKRATFSLAPGQPSRPPTTTPIEGLLLAGDWVDTGLPATIESAAVSGHRAAAAA